MKALRKLQNKVRLRLGKRLKAAGIALTLIPLLGQNVLSAPPDTCLAYGRNIVAKVFSKEVNKEGGMFWKRRQVLGTWYIADEGLCVTVIKEKGRRKVTPVFHTATGRFYFPTDKIIDLYTGNPWGKLFFAELEKLAPEDVKTLEGIAASALGVPRKVKVVFVADGSPASKKLLSALLVYVAQGRLKVFLVPTQNPNLYCQPTVNLDQQTRVFEAYLKDEILTCPTAEKERYGTEVFENALEFLKSKEIPHFAVVFTDGFVWENPVEDEENIETLAKKIIERAEISALKAQHP